LLSALVLAGCATGSSAKHGAAAAKRGEWDAAVAYYRQALDSDPKKIELQIELERATRQASAQHLARGRELESQDQLSAAAAEYRRAIEFDPSNSLALTRALDVERRIREQIEASRPQSRLDQMRAQAQATSPIPRLDPRAPLPALRFTNNAVRDVLNAIGTATGIGIQYDQGLEGTVGRPFSIDLSGHSLESAFNMVLSQNTLAYKILDSKTIFIYLDNQGNRAKYEDVYQQTFYLSHGEVGEVSQILNQMLTTTTAGNRPVVTQNKGANAIVVRASAPMLGVIKNIIDGADKPKAEVLIDVTILEVSRSSLKNLGLDLSTYAITLSFSPSGPPAVGPAPPIQVGGVTNQFNKNNVYAALPSAIINILESDQKTRLLAKPQLRGREGSQLLLNLGQDVPIVTTTFQSVATGGVPTVPQSSYTFRPIGVNLSITPKVTYQDEIILDPITVDKSAIGPNVITGGQSLQSFIKRTATVSMRLRDGESNLLAGLVLQEDRETARSIPGILHIPILRSIFGNTDTSNDQSDVVMIVTPHIIRSRDITAEDLKPFYVGTSNNLGAASAPGLVSQAPPPGPAPTGTPIPGSTVPVPTPTATPTAPPMPPATTPPPRAVAIEPANNAPAPQPPSAGAQLLITVPSAELQKDGAPYTLPVSISNVSQLSAVTLTITYDPKVLKATAVSQGTFMSQGNVTPIFVPKIDEATGRVDVAISRGATNPGANGTNVLIGIAFQAIGAGTSKITVTGTAMTPESKPIPLQLPPPGTVIVK
jgi:general secretion pathway protein D